MVELLGIDERTFQKFIWLFIFEQELIKTRNYQISSKEKYNKEFFN